MTAFVKDLLERAVKTFVQTFAVGFVVPSVADVFDATAWERAGYAAAAGALVATASVITSLLSKPFGPDSGDASLVV